MVATVFQSCLSVLPTVFQSRLSVFSSAMVATVFASWSEGDAAVDFEHAAGEIFALNNEFDTLPDLFPLPQPLQSHF